jgi:hypothetical protein
MYVFHYFFPPQVLYFAEAWSGILSANPDPEVQAYLFKKKELAFSFATLWLSFARRRR